MLVMVGQVHEWKKQNTGLYCFLPAESQTQREDTVMRLSNPIQLTIVAQESPDNLSQNKTHFVKLRGKNGRVSAVHTLTVGQMKVQITRLETLLSMCFTCPNFFGSNFLRIFGGLASVSPQE